MTKNKEVVLQDLGLIEYQKAWDYQEEIFDHTIQTKISNRINENNPEVTSNFLLLCEHPHVFTLGKSGKAENLLVNQEQLTQINATYHKINRGGDITYHGPGQLVGYPIFDLDNFFTDIHKYLRFLEEAIIKTCSDYGIVAGRYSGYTGVWLDGDKPNARKICAMGVRCSRWVTMHGFAFNVNTNLEYFKHIVPCGIDDKAVTSLQLELGYTVDMEEVKRKFLAHFLNIFEAQLNSCIKQPQHL
jgi:lipoyl(octanoyl) transferase